LDVQGSLAIDPELNTKESFSPLLIQRATIPGSSLIIRVRPGLSQ
jgi:hypothetical protein